MDIRSTVRVCTKYNTTYSAELNDITSGQEGQVGDGGEYEDAKGELLGKYVEMPGVTVYIHDYVIFSFS